MHYAEIKEFDIANGLGVRVSLFVSGCTHRCPECFNEVAWNFSYGKEFTEETIKYLMKALEPDHIAGLSLLGGEPMELANQEGLMPLLREFKKTYPTKNVWCYTGYLLEDLLDGGKVHGKYTDELLSYIDILVDGPFILKLKNIRLKFRGSENQRVICLKETLAGNSVVLWEEK